LSCLLPNWEEKTREGEERREEADGRVCNQKKRCKEGLNSDVNIVLKCDCMAVAVCIYIFNNVYYFLKYLLY
jgi:hypothetical protein